MENNKLLEKLSYHLNEEEASNKTFEDLIEYMDRKYHPFQVNNCILYWVTSRIGKNQVGRKEGDGLTWAYRHNYKPIKSYGTLMIHLGVRNPAAPLYLLFRGGLYVEAYIETRETNIKILYKEVTAKYDESFEKLANNVMKNLDNIIEPIVVKFSKGEHKKDDEDFEDFCRINSKNSYLAQDLVAAIEDHDYIISCGFSMTADIYYLIKDCFEDKNSRIKAYINHIMSLSEDGLFSCDHMYQDDSRKKIKTTDWKGKPVLAKSSDLYYYDGGSDDDHDYLSECISIWYDIVELLERIKTKTAKEAIDYIKQKFNRSIGTFGIAKVVES